MSYGGGGVVYLYPSAGYVFGPVKKHVRDGRASSVYASACEGMLITHELVDALLQFSDKVAIDEMVAVEALMGSAVGAVDISEWETR